ncbi:MAG: cytochrome c oxidase assembly protein [Alphaproteobacteria bacterium]|nr:cytochrome c oxidase assembly protein [Alphaproteobacteria bacterium]
MLGAAFQAPALYNAFCQITGYGGETRIAEAAADRVLDRTIEVRFDANVAPGLPLRFEPVDHLRSLRLGETGIAFYRITNTSDRPVRAVATYNVAPHKVGPFFRKLQCFCFQDTVYQPGETVEAAVVFFVDPDLADDRDTEEVQQVTLSYTYFASVDQAAAALAPAS